MPTAQNSGTPLPFLLLFAPFDPIQCLVLRDVAAAHSCSVDLGIIGLICIGISINLLVLKQIKNQSSTGHKIRWSLSSQQFHHLILAVTDDFAIRRPCDGRISFKPPKNAVVFVAENLTVARTSFAAADDFRFSVAYVFFHHISGVLDYQNLAAGEGGHGDLTDT